MGGHHHLVKPDITFTFDGEAQVPVEADRHQIGQAMTNVLKNAIEAIEQRAKAEDIAYRGRIAVSLVADRHAVTVTVAVLENSPSKT